MRNHSLFMAGVATLSILFIGLFFHWTINRIYVEDGCSLQLRYKGPLLFGKRESAKAGHFAKEGQIGILEKLRGPGRHFYCPIWWERQIVDHENKGRGDINVQHVVKPGEVAIVRSALGEELPKGEYLVDGDLGETEFKGTLRKVLGPGFYRAHPYAYELNIVQTEQRESGGQIKHSGWVEIPTGYVGVVTNKTSIPATDNRSAQNKGIQDDVLPPGIYAINGREQEIDIVEIGYRETTIEAIKQRKPSTDGKPGELLYDENGEPVLADGNKGINFPSDDGFLISMDFTAVWGIMPHQAPSVIKTFGNISAIENKVIIPQIESICRNTGSKKKADDLLIGEGRQEFQDAISEDFRKMLDDKEISSLTGLVRAIYIPSQVRQPIQMKYIADELKLTRDQENLTTQKEAELEEVKKEVDLVRQEVNSETEKLIAGIKAEGKKKVGEIGGETEKLISEIDVKVAQNQAKATVLLGKAEADVERFKKEAEAERFKLAVDAFGSGEAYNNYIFASSLPEKGIELQLIHAGEGTFWTDLKGFSNVALGNQLQESQAKKPNSK